MKKMFTLLASVFTMLIIITACNNPGNRPDYLILIDQEKSDTISLQDLQLLKQIAGVRNKLIEIGRVRLENVSLEDQKKVTGIAGELLDRAEQKILGELPAGRFGWSWQGFDEPEGMIAMAEEFLDVLATDKDPLEGKFAEPGGYVVDHAIIKKDDLWHLIYIRGIAVTNWPEYPLSNFGHAVSKDLKSWKIEKPVLNTSDELFDSYQVWAPHIIYHNGEYWIFYTGVNDSVTQSICLARSKDLYNWDRHENNPVHISLPWGNWDEQKWSDCRDPMVLKEGDTFYCYFTAARIVPETGKHEFCMGMASSKNLTDWKDEGFLRLEHTLDTPPESPFVVKRNNEFYLFYTNYKHGIVYIKSNDPLKGWKENPEDPQSILKGVSATEIITENGKWYITLISHMNNGLHFFETREMVWEDDGGVKVLERN